MTWPADDRSFKGALSLRTLGEYCAALHVDVLHSVNDLHFPLPKVNKLITLRLRFQNALATVQRWNDEILNCEGVKERTCVNAVKHREPQIFVSKALHEAHTVECYGHVTVKAAPQVFVVEDDVVVEDEYVGHGRDRGRGVAH